MTDSTIMHPLLILGLLLVVGYVAGIAANALRLPRVTGYIAAGLALSPSISGILDKSQVNDHLFFVTDITLGIIAFAIGGSLLISRVKMVGRQILWITLSQGMGAMLFAGFALYAAGLFTPTLHVFGSVVFLNILIIGGAISVATAPAAVLAVLHEIRAKGTLTTVLLGIVALDDALTIMLFSIAATVTQALLATGSTANAGIVHGFIEIGGSLAIGTIGGYILPRMMGSTKRAEIHLTAVLGIIFLIGGVCNHLGFSALLSNMMMGFVVVNGMRHADHLFHELATIEESLYCLFFALAGAHFDIGVLPASLGLGAALLIGRFSGKILGTVAGARFSHAPQKIKKYLGITLLPQAGLSVGLILLARPLLPEEIYELLLNALLASVILNEILAPPLLKWALTKAGESLSESRP